MRKIILPILSVVALAIITGGVLDGCTTEGNHSDTIDTVVLQPKQLLDLGDSTDVMTVTGVVTDGAMNSVMVEVDDDSIMEFSYSELDRGNSDVYESWEIDDRITVSYVKTMHGDEEVDSVISIKKAD